MKIEVVDKKDEKMLSRMQVTASLEFENATPNYTEVTTALATKIKADEKLIAIRHIYTAYGNKKAKVIAYLYNDEAKKAFFEPKIKEKKPAAK